MISYVVDLWPLDKLFIPTRADSAKDIRAAISAFPINLKYNIIILSVGMFGTELIFNLIGFETQ